MKTKQFLKVSSLLMVLLFSSVYSFAQDEDAPDSKPVCRLIENIPGITDEQKQQAETLAKEHWEKVKSLHDQLKAKMDDYHALMTVEKTDQTAINNKIEDIMAVKKELMKERTSHLLEIKAMLTAEQVKVFNENIKNHPGHKPGNGQGKGYGPGQGRGKNCPYRK